MRSHNEIIGAPESTAFLASSEKKHTYTMKGTIFDIKRYAIHDGPGIRTTVFFKGCPLRCLWCHNPEGIAREPEIMFRPERCSVECQDCVSVCPQRAIMKKRRVISIDRKRCDLCAKCEEACAYEAVELVGKEVSVQEILDEIEKDRIFYDESKGGVTFSGGEPLAQPEFLLDLLIELNKRNVHTTVDTSGFVPSEIIEKISQRTDLLLYDLKVMDEEMHKKYTGESNTLILENLRKLSENGKKVIVRMPVLSGVNDDDENIQKQAEFLKSCGNINEINLLLYHRGGEVKRKRLRKKEPLVDFQSPSDKRLQEIKDRLSSYGFSVKIGG